MNGHETNGTTSELPFIDLSFDSANPEKSALELVYRIQPKWREHQDQLKLTKFTDGITNTLFKISRTEPGASQDQIDSESILMRAYGNQTELIIDRDREAKSHELCASRGLAPPLLGRFENGLLYGYIPGRACTAEDLTQEPIWRAVARKLGQWHALLPTGEGGTHRRNSYTNGHRRPSMTGLNGVAVPVHPYPNGYANGVNGLAESPVNTWTVLQRWLDVVPSETPKQKARKELLHSELQKSIRELDTGRGPGRNGLVLGHCDLLCANVIIIPQKTSGGSEDSETKVTFIDYEYATPCAAAFDIANHLAECIRYDCDYTKIPTRSVRQEFLKEYLQSYDLHSKNTFPSPLESRLDALMQQVDQYRGIPGLYWGIWALIQATISKIDFDYASYAELRLGEYWAWRAEESGSRRASGQERTLREQRWAES